MRIILWFYKIIKLLFCTESRLLLWWQPRRCWALADIIRNKAQIHVMVNNRSFTGIT